jgi:SAM-dependent methyltransferase
LTLTLKIDDEVEMLQDPMFEDLVQNGMQLPFSGWDFSVIGNRWTSQRVSWDYKALVRQRMAGVQRMLDMDTGGGEFLASLAPLPPETWASENYAPNVPLARERLEPLGVKIFSDYTNDTLPCEADYFDLVLNRHGGFKGSEIHRILKPGGIFLTQQVGGKNNIRLNELLQDQVYFEYSYWTLEEVVRWLQEAGLVILTAQEEYPEEHFYDIGAVVFYLRVISWQVADFSVEKYRDKLYAIHQIIQREGRLVTHSHRILVEARKT